MFYRRQHWAQLIRNGVPSLYVVRPLAGGFTPPNLGDEYPAPDPTNKFQMMRARQMYEQRRIGTWPELELTLRKTGQVPPSSEGRAPAPAPAKTGKERKNGHRNP